MDTAEVVAPAHEANRPVPAHQLAFLASPAVWLCFTFFFLTTSAFGILQNYAPAILGNVYGVSLVLATSAVRRTSIRRERAARGDDEPCGSRTPPGAPDSPTRPPAHPSRTPPAP